MLSFMANCPTSGLGCNGRRGVVRKTNYGAPMAGPAPLSSRTPHDLELLAQAEAADRPLGAPRPIAGGDAWVMPDEPGGQLWTAEGRPPLRVIDQRPGARSSVHRLPALAATAPDDQG
jgi:hypothetical protein